MDKQYRFCYYGTREQFFNLVKYGSVDKKIHFSTKSDADETKGYILSTTDDQIKFGIESLGHIGGNWYIPEIIEYNDRIELVGSIQFIGSKHALNVKSRFRDKAFIILFVLLFLPIILLTIVAFSLILIIHRLIDKIRGKKEVKKTTEERLYDLMVNCLGCVAI